VEEIVSNVVRLYISSCLFIFT